MHNIKEIRCSDCSIWVICYFDLEQFNALTKNNVIDFSDYHSDIIKRICSFPETIKQAYAFLLFAREKKLPMYSSLYYDGVKKFALDKRYCEEVYNLVLNNNNMIEIQTLALSTMLL